jgi:hypothetical protein
VHEVVHKFSPTALIYGERLFSFAAKEDSLKTKTSLKALATAKGFRGGFFISLN